MNQEQQNNEQWYASNKLILDAFDLERIPEITLEDFINMLSGKVQYMLDHNTEELFSKLYRLDVAEERIKEAFGHENIAQKIAALIVERQLEKMDSRKNFKTPKPDDDLAW
ncbi:hypothetical protein [Edaphocola aurantiacus]|uniref:hypothetical protein n=1 Tax=Edaphocola aurantiacus TaxID=2601682 RepID=UPI001C9381AD|nr:hypothetical protein [Edaphocola aurantiacus]